MKRKKVLTAISSILFALLPPLGASAQSASPSADSLPFALKPFGHNIYAAIDDAKGDAGANAGFVIGNDGVLVIDTFENEAAAKQLLSEIRKLTALPIKFVVNTHYHLDHVAGNAVFKQAGAVVIAQRNVFSWIHTENLKFFGKDIKPEQKAMVEALSAPDVLYDTQIEIVLGSRKIIVDGFPGHTGGDSVVRIPDAEVFFCGDLFWRNTLPNLIDASTDNWIETLYYIRMRSPSKAVVYVPGHGDPGDFHDIEAFTMYLDDLRGLVQKQIQENKTGNDLVSAVLPAIEEKYGKWAYFDYFAKSNILDMAAELRRTKKIPAAALLE